MIPAPIQPPNALRVQLRLAAENLWQRVHTLDEHTAASEIEQLAIGFDAARRTALMLGQAQTERVRG